MKKILMLGGAMQQIPAIAAAKKMGLYVITCDYLPENPGHQYSDAYYNVSTTDKEAVLEKAAKALSRLSTNFRVRNHSNVSFIKK